MKTCECGCGRPAPIAKCTEGGYKKGQAKRFIHGHSRREPLDIRFWRYVNKQGPILMPTLGECWVWKGNTDNNGRGTLELNQRPIKAYRIAWFIETGKWPEPFCLHKCDNGLCVRFSHLFEGNQGTNMRDMVAKERGCNKLTTQNVRDIRRELSNGVVGAQLARQYGVTRTTIWEIKHGITWKEVSL